MMIEYRLYNLNEELMKIFEKSDFFVAEENFHGSKTFLIYSDEDISDILTSFGLRFDSKDVEETGWQEKWKEYVKEDWLTDKIFFIFEPKTFDDGRKTIYINPSLAFGTGAHPTTQAAAQLIEKVAMGRKVLDVGTGSAILAILSEICGATQVDAFDIDKDALPNCLENIKNNNCTKISARCGDISDYNEKTYDVVAANIISSVLKELAPTINKIAKEYIVYSGILASEYDEAIPQLIPPDGQVEEKIVIGEWAGALIKLSGKK